MEVPFPEDSRDERSPFLVADCAFIDGENLLQLSGELSEGYLPVSIEAPYNRRTGYGFDFGSYVRSVLRASLDQLTNVFCTSDRPIFFSVAGFRGPVRLNLYAE
jgi:hypothetical protein